MIDIILLLLVGVAFFCYGYMACGIIDYLIRVIKFKNHIRKAPDCCMCGAEHPNQCGNHSYESQLDWYIRKYTPMIR